MVGGGDAQPMKYRWPPLVMLNLGAPAPQCEPLGSDCYKPASACSRPRSDVSDRKGLATSWIPSWKRPLLLVQVKQGFPIDYLGELLDCHPIFETGRRVNTAGDGHVETRHRRFPIGEEGGDEKEDTTLLAGVQSAEGHEAIKRSGLPGVL
jgi:hypothetical protein